MSSHLCFKNGDSELLGKGTALVLSLNLNPNFLETQQNPYNPPDVAITSRIQIRNSLSDDCRWKFNKLCGGILVMAVYQQPGSAIVGTKHRSTVISLFNDMCAKDKEFR